MASSIWRDCFDGVQTLSLLWYAQCEIKVGVIRIGVMERGRRADLHPLNAAKAERAKTVPLALVQHAFKPGQSGNPGGRSVSFAECQRLARESSPDAMRRLIELMASPDERVALMAADKVLERAWGKPREYDPDSSVKRYSEMSPEAREREIARLIAEGRTVIEQAKLMEQPARRHVGAGRNPRIKPTP